MPLGLRVGLYGGPLAGVSVGLPNSKKAAAQPRIVLIIGQSNALGRGDFHTLTDASLAVPLSAVQLKQQLAETNASNIVWDSYATLPTHHRTVSPTENCGVELKLAYYLNAVVEGGWGLAKIAVGSSDLDVDWNPAGTYPNGGPPNLFNQAMNFARAAQTELGGTIAAVLWLQGEADAADTTKASNYLANMIALLAAIRTNFPGVPFIFNRLNAANPGAFAGTVRTAQTNFLADPGSTKVQQIASDGATLQVDNVHYTSDGYVTLGRLFSIAILNQLAINIPPVAAFTSVVTGLSIAFTNTSTDDDGTIVSHLWNFGDGQTSTLASPTHVYASGATYTVTLTETDNAGGVNTVTHSVTAVNATWAVDATSGIACPITAQQWTDLFTNFSISMVAPDSLWPLQEASGNPVDTLGGITLTAAGAPAYQQAVAGWTRTGIKFTDGSATHKLSSASASLPDMSTAGMAVLLYYANATTPAANRSLISFGLNTNNLEARVTTTPAFQARSGTATAGSATSCGTTGRALLMVLNRTGGVCGLYTDQDALEPTFNTGANGKTIKFGASNASASGGTLMYAAAWYSTHGEITKATAKSLLQAVGFTVPWS